MRLYAFCYVPQHLRPRSLGRLYVLSRSRCSSVWHVLTIVQYRTICGVMWLVAVVIVRQAYYSVSPISLYAALYKVYTTRLIQSVRGSRSRSTSCHAWGGRRSRQMSKVTDDHNWSRVTQQNVFPLHHPGVLFSQASHSLLSIRL